MLKFPSTIRPFALPLLLLAFTCGWIALQDSPPAGPASTGSLPLPLQPSRSLPPAEPQVSEARKTGSLSLSVATLPATAESTTASSETTPNLPRPARDTWPPAAKFMTTGPHQSVLELPNDQSRPARPTIPTEPEMGEFNWSAVQPALEAPEAGWEETAEPTLRQSEPAAVVTPIDFSVLSAEELTPPRESAIPIQSENARGLAVGKVEAFPQRHLPTAAAPLLTASVNQPTTPYAAPPSAAVGSGTASVGQLTANPATAYLLDSLKPPRTTDGQEVPPTIEDFSEPPVNFDSFNPTADMQIYQGKRLYGTQRPLLELGRPWYQLGQLPPPQSWLGLHNPVSQQFLVFGDFRSAVAANQLGGDSQSLIAWQSNLFFDWRLTGTERFHFNINPNTQGANNSRYLLDDDDFISEFNADVNFGFFEGDVGAILGGFTNQTLPFDLPIALGVMPLVIQNGVWLDDAFLGAAATIPARNSPLLDISNYDITFFAGWDKLDSPAFGNDDNAAKLYGIASWWEALNGYIEADYAFVEDRDSLRDRSYHNLGFAYTRRFGHLLSNSTRVLVNAGQSTRGGENTADGVLLLSENSLITANPSTILPYFNLFAGFDRPQSVGRAGIAGGILRNTGILFESDNLTGYPTLDATANQTYGMALGLSLMPQNFSQQLVLEGAMLGVMGDDLGRSAAAAQRGVGFRYQLPLNNSIIFRVDGMYGFLAETEDISGLRVELRRKF